MYSLLILMEAEKMELRDEKQRLKAQKEKLEQKLTFVSTQPGFQQPPPSMAALFAPQHPPAGSKFVPIVSYPGVAMWQFMLPAAIDTSQDHVLALLLPNSGLTIYELQHLMIC